LFLSRLHIFLFDSFFVFLLCVPLACLLLSSVFCFSFLMSLLLFFVSSLFLVLPCSFPFLSFFVSLSSLCCGVCC
jgi:hypothetical protein